MFDIVIKNGWVLDGSGNPWVYADVGVVKDRIAQIGNLSRMKAGKTIDAKGKIVCPGFIDTHSHSDLVVFTEPELKPKVMQGITTELFGQDGLAVAPIRPENESQLRRMVSGLQGDPPIRWTWRSFNDYLRRIQRTKPSINIAGLVGHGAVRLEVMGMDARDPTPAELRKMKAIVEESMEGGAAGFSTALIYPPNFYAKTGELIELCKAAHKHGGIFVVHMRSETTGRLKALREVITVCEESGIPLHVSHLKSAGKNQWHKSQDMLDLLDAARARGLDVTFDQYPYEAGSTHLHAVLPPWVHDGGPDAIIQRITDHKTRERIKRDSAKRATTWENFVYESGWENIYVSAVRKSKNKKFEGKSVADVGKMTGKSPADAAMDLLVDEDLAVSMVLFMNHEEDIKNILGHPLGIVATDGLMIGKSHPRAYGTYPRILRRYVRQEKVLPLQEAVRKMTSAPAQRLGLGDRGLVREKYLADLVVFDPGRITDTATYEKPRQHPKGIDYVIVNGKVTVEKGRHVGARAGKVLFHGR